MQLSTMELLIVSVGLSIDVFVAAAYMGAGFSKIRWKNLAERNEVKIILLDALHMKPS